MTTTRPDTTDGAEPDERVGEPERDTDVPDAPVSPRRTTLIVAVLLLLAELVARAVAAEGDPRYEEAESISQAALELRRSDGSTALVLGSNEVDGVLSEAEAESTAPGWTVRSAVTNLSTISMWHAVYDHHFSEGETPDVVVIGFTTTQLRDQNRVDWATIGRHYTTRRSLPDRWRSAPDISAKLDVAASRASTLVGSRAWFSQLWADPLPHHASVPRREREADVVEPTYDLLTDAIEQMRSDGAAVLVVALPRAGGYGVDESLIAAVEDAGGTYVDLRLPDELSDEDFVTQATLTPTASALFTERLMEQVVTLVDQP